MKKRHDLTDGRPGSALLGFALPIILGNLFQQFYNMADSMIVGKYVGEDALAAVGASYSFTTVFIMIAIGGGMGASVLVSQFLGAGKYERLKTAVNTFLTTFGVVSVLLAVFGFFMNPLILRALGTPENIYSDAVMYLQIYFIGLPFMFLYNVLSADFNALGRSEIPLGLLIFSSILNVVLDIWMVAGFQLGVAGVAVATVAAQGISSAISFVILRRILKRYPAGRGIAFFDAGLCIRGMKIAVPSIIQQSIVSIGMLLTQSAVNRFGSSALAGYSVGTRLESLCIVPMLATGNAMSTFTAQNLGARREERVKTGYRAAVGMIAGFGLLLIILSQMFYRPVVAAFVSERTSPEAFATAASYFRFIGWFFSLLGLKSVTDAVLRGSGDVGVYMIANLANLGVRVAVAQLASPIWGISFVWYAVPMGWFLNFFISWLWYRSGNWKKKRLVSAAE